MPRAQRGRNPYEIRYDTLTLAKDILSENARFKRDSDRDIRQDHIRQDHIKNPNNVDILENNDQGLYDPCTFTTQDVITEATKLYEFIDPPSNDNDNVATTDTEIVQRRGAGQRVIPPKTEGRPTLSAIQEASGLPSSEADTPTEHPDAGKRVTVLNNPDLHVSLSADTLHVWHNDHLYQGTLTISPTSRLTTVHGIPIQDTNVIHRIEDALSNATRLRGTQVKIHPKDGDVVPAPAPRNVKKTLDDGTKISLNIYPTSVNIDIHTPHATGRIYMARLRPTSSNHYLLIPDEDDTKIITKIPSHILDTIEQTVAEHITETTQGNTIFFVRFQGR